MEANRTYIPREGIDYLVDLYALTDVERDADQATIDAALDARMLEYHPDRVHNLAQEFQDRAAVVAPLLGRARKVLRDPSLREEYDALLGTWEGPLSKDGIPTITVERYHQALRSQMDETELRDSLAATDEHAALLTGFDPKQLASAKELAGRYPDDADIRETYEQHLLKQDRMLAVQEANRRSMTANGVTDIGLSNYQVGVGYAQQTTLELEAVRTRYIDEQHRIAVTARAASLILESGDVVDAKPQDALEVPLGLPVHLTLLTAQIEEIAKEREAVMQTRLSNMQLDYPEQALQAEHSDKLIVGIRNLEQEITWIALQYQQGVNAAEGISIPRRIKKAVGAGKYSQAFDAGYNVCIVPLLEQIDPVAVITEAANRHYQGQGGPSGDSHDNK